MVVGLDNNNMFLRKYKAPKSLVFPHLLETIDGDLIPGYVMSKSHLVCFDHETSFLGKKFKTSESKF